MNAPAKGTRTRAIYTDETRARAVELSDTIGVKAAALELGVNPNALNTWRRKARLASGVAPFAKQNYDLKTQRAAVRLAKKLGNVCQAGNVLGIHRATLARWVKLSDEGLLGPPKRTKHRPDVREQLLLLAKEIGVSSAARKMGIAHSTAFSWWTSTHAPATPNQPHPDETKKAAIALARESSSLNASRTLGLPYSSVSHWVRESRIAEGTHRPRRTWSKEFQSEVLQTAKSIGPHAAAKQFDLSTKKVKQWLVEAGEHVPGRRERIDSDGELQWVKQEYPQYERWRRLAVAWISTLPRGLKERLSGMRKLFPYLARVQAPSDPATFLHLARPSNDFYENECPKSNYGVTLNNAVHEFVQWVLQRECSVEDDLGDMVVSPAFRNPFPLRSHGGMVRRQTTVYSPLPYGYITELRGILAGGPTFRDWKFAQNALGAAEGFSGQPAPDWFDVDPSVIDPSDPDCVYRWRESTRGERTLQMWSPVRWVALLIKLILPLRNFQVSVLDSGESDTWVYTSDREQASSSWKKNTTSLARAYEDGRTWQQGVLRRVSVNHYPTGSAESKAIASVLYINTNKTADSGLDGPAKGYIIPWIDDGELSSNPFYWLEKLRDWQSKYNPISRRTSWDELKGKHINKKSDIQLAGYPDACFLFRLPEAPVGQRHLPMSEGMMDTPWYELLAGYEARLGARGERLADGSTIRLVGPSNRRALFPLHSLRVSIITALATEGKLSLVVLQKLVGHSSLLMTLYYVNMGPAGVVAALEESFKKMDEARGGGIVSFLANASLNELESDAAFNDLSSGLLALGRHPAARNPAGWMEMHHGACLVGGNTTPIEDSARVGGCYNGGPNDGPPSKPRHGPVPGGARNCVRCRWFVTRPRFLPALVAHFNVLMYHRGVAERDWRLHSDTLMELQRVRASSEEAGRRFAEGEQLKVAERRVTKSIAELESLTADADACLTLVERCIRALTTSGASDDVEALVAVGAHSDVRFALEKVDSELLLLSSVCEAVEVYPDLDAGKAILVRSQILEAALVREGKEPFLLFLPEEEQLRVGNEVLRSMARATNPQDPRLGLRRVVGLIEAREQLGDLLNLNREALLKRCEKPVSMRSLLAH